MYILQPLTRYALFLLYCSVVELYTLAGDLWWIVVRVLYWQAQRLIAIIMAIIATGRDSWVDTPQNLTEIMRSWAIIK